MAETREAAKLLATQAAQQNIPEAATAQKDAKLPDTQVANTDGHNAAQTLPKAQTADQDQAVAET